MAENLRNAADEALKTMLRPVVRFWLQRMGSIQRLVGFLKEIFVEIAVEELSKKDERVTISRISVMTGLHRTDVSKIFKGEAEETRSIPDVVTRVIGQWENAAAFREKDGTPKILSIKGRKSDFAKLVGTVSKSIGPPSVLFELERTGSIERVDGGIKLVYPALRSTGNYERSISLVSRNVQTMFKAVDENIHSRNEIPHYMIRTEYDNILKSAVPELRAWLNKEGKKFHKRIRERLANLDQDISPVVGEAGGVRVVVGGFSCIEEPDSEESKPQ